MAVELPPRHGGTKSLRKKNPSKGMIATGVQRHSKKTKAMRYLILFLLAIGAASCEEKEKKFVCGTCEEQIHNIDTVKKSKNELGKMLFKVHCASCHNASEVRATGPGLHGVIDRIPGGDWKYHFIRNADSVIKSGDAYANAIFEEYNKTPHTRFPDLSNEEIDAILDCFN